MARRILSVDLGTTALRTVLLRDTFRGIEILELLESAPPDPEQPLSDVLQGLFQQLRARPDQVVLAVPAMQVVFRTLILPFTEPRKIQQVLPFELESRLPFPLEEIVWDWFSLGTAGPWNGKVAGNRCVAAVARKESLRPFQEALRGSGVPGRILEVDAMGLYHLYRHGQGEAAPVLIVDLGASKTSLCGIGPEGPSLFRVLPLGGNTLTQRLAQDLGISWEEAEERKQALRLDSEGPDPIREALFQALHPLLQTLVHTLRWWEIQYREPFRQVLLTGGGSHLGGLERYLSHALGVPVRQWTLPEGAFRGNRSLTPSWYPALGLALRGRLRRPGIALDLQEKGFLSLRESLERRRFFLQWGALLLGVLTLGGVDFALHYWDRAVRYEALRQEVRQVFRETFPDVPRVVNEVAQMQAAIARLRDRIQTLGGRVSSGPSPLEILQILSSRIPPELPMEIQEFRLDRGRIHLQGNTDRFESADRIKQILEQVPQFRKVEIADAKLSADQSRVKFRIRMELVP